MEFINWNIVSHPVNWITVFLMLFIGLMFAHFILSYFAGNSPAGSSGQ